MSCKTDACGGTSSLSQIQKIHFPYCPLCLRPSFVKAPLVFLLLYIMSHLHWTRRLFPPSVRLSQSFPWLLRVWRPHIFFHQSPLSTKAGPKVVLSRSGRIKDCKPVTIKLNLNTYTSLTALTCSWQITKTLICAFRIVTPLLTNISLWLTGTDIVQWLMKNLVIEDPGKPAEKPFDKTHQHSN